MTIANNSNSGTVNIDSFLLQYKIEGKGLPAIVIGSVYQYPLGIAFIPVPSFLTLSYLLSFIR